MKKEIATLKANTTKTIKCNKIACFHRLTA